MEWKHQFLCMNMSKIWEMLWFSNCKDHNIFPLSKLYCHWFLYQYANCTQYIFRFQYGWELEYGHMSISINHLNPHSFLFMVQKFLNFTLVCLYLVWESVDMYFKKYTYTFVLSFSIFSTFLYSNLSSYHNLCWSSFFLLILNKMFSTW